MSKKGRPSDTRALASAASSGGSSSCSISVEPIDNGFLIRKTEMTQTGEYKSSCLYSKEAPQVEMEISGAPEGERRALKDTVEYMGKR